MKSLKDYITAALLKEDKGDDKSDLIKGDIKFTIWGADGKIKDWCNSNLDYQKIEYKYEDTDAGIKIDFLLGYNENSWKLWIGKIGAVTYSDTPYKDLKVTDFKEAVLAALEFIEKFINDVKTDKHNFVQYYINF